MREVPTKGDREPARARARCAPADDEPEGAGRAPPQSERSWTARARFCAFSAGPPSIHHAPARPRRSPLPYVDTQLAAVTAMLLPMRVAVQTAVVPAGVVTSSRPTLAAAFTIELAPAVPGVWRRWRGERAVRCVRARFRGARDGNAVAE